MFAMHSLMVMGPCLDSRVQQPGVVAKSAWDGSAPSLACCFSCRTGSFRSRLLRSGAKPSARREDFGRSVDLGQQLRRLGPCFVESPHDPSRIHQVECSGNVVGAPMTRRLALLMQMVAIGSEKFPALADGISSQEPPAGNAVLRSLGIGDPDIYYPRFFEGTWDCFSTLVSLDTPQGEDKVDLKSVDFSRKQIGYTVVYQARFVPYNSNIIGDRLFTTKSLVESTMGKDVISDSSWSPQQPNRLTLELQGGTKVENLVTKRSAGVSAPGQFDTSEYSKQVFENRRGGAPTVKASRNLTRYRWDTSQQSVSRIEAVQRVAMYPVPGSDFDTMDIFSMANPITVYKYLVVFTRAS